MGNGLDAKHAFAFGIDLQSQLAAVQLEDRQIIRRSLNRDFPFGRALCSPAIFRTMLVSADGFDGLEIEWGTAAVDERLKHLFHVPAYLKDQVATVFDLIVGVLIMEPRCASVRRSRARSTHRCKSNARRPGSVAL